MVVTARRVNLLKFGHLTFSRPAGSRDVAKTLAVFMAESRACLLPLRTFGIVYLVRNCWNIHIERTRLQ